MKTVTYTIPTPGVPNTTPEISVTDSFSIQQGHLLLSVNLDNIVGFRETTFPYIKFLVDFGDGTIEEISNQVGFSNTLSAKAPTINHVYETDETIIKNIPIKIKGLKTNLLFDTFEVFVRNKRPKIREYGDMELIKTHIFDVDESKYGVLVIAGPGGGIYI